MTIQAAGYSTTNDRTDRIRFGSARGALVGAGLGGATLLAGSVDIVSNSLRMRVPTGNWGIAAASLAMAGFAGVAVAHIANSSNEDSRHTAGVVAAAIPGAVGGALLGSKWSAPMVGRIGGAVAGGVAGALATAGAAFFGLPSVMADS
jgi:hypothetical protein